MLKKAFESFDNTIQPDQDIKNRCREEHTELRAKIASDEVLKKIHIADFLQGSYARSTMLDLGEPDVDVVLVTKLPSQLFTPEQALQMFMPFCEKHYGKQNVTLNGRSICIDRGELSLDLVPTSAPSEAVIQNLSFYEMLMNSTGRILSKAINERSMASDEELDYDEVFGASASIVAEGDWAKEPLLIPDRHSKTWQETHPLATKQFTVEKNRRCDKLFLRVVRAMKWWKKQGSGHEGHPKSYPIEHMVGDHCPDKFDFVGEAIAHTFEAMLIAYEPWAKSKTVPILVPRGLDGKDNGPNVLGLVTAEDFAAFVEVLRQSCKLAVNAIQTDDEERAMSLWAQLFGTGFPNPGGTPSGGYGGYPIRRDRGGKARERDFA
jgi:Second Messenger Oligonucleotide or Dinucleotide Synthetase domain